MMVVVRQVEDGAEGFSKPFQGAEYSNNRKLSQDSVISICFQVSKNGQKGIL